MERAVEKEDGEMEGKDKMTEKNGEEMPERDEQEDTLTMQRYIFAANKVFSFNCHFYFLVIKSGAEIYISTWPGIQFSGETIPSG